MKVKVDLDTSVLAWLILASCTRLVSRSVYGADCLANRGLGHIHRSYYCKKLLICLSKGTATKRDGLPVIDDVLCCHNGNIKRR
jgi:hypothetical protein